MSAPAELRTELDGDELGTDMWFHSFGNVTNHTGAGGATIPVSKGLSFKYGPE